MKRKRVWRIVIVALIVVWAVVIFSFSAQPVWIETFRAGTGTDGTEN